MIDDIKHTLDSRITVTDIKAMAEAPIVFVCRCGYSQPIDNIKCSKCRRIL